MKNKRALITGGTTGIGRAIAKRFADDGAKVMIFGREEKALKEAIASIKGKKNQVIGMVADQAVLENIERVFLKVDSELGGLDILVNNAGLAASMVTDSEYEEWKYVVETNLLGYMACCKFATARFQAQKKGHIVNIGSMSADAEDSGNVYVATKAGIRGFTKSFAPEANKMGIRVTLIEPGLVGSDMTKEDVKQQELWQAQGKMLKAEDIADCVAYAVGVPERCAVEFVQIRPRLEEE